MGADRVAHARTQHDVNGITKSISGVPLVFVHVTRLHNALSWAVQMHDISTGPKPLIVCQGVPDGLDESPGPVIVLRGGGRQPETALNSLLQQQPATWTGPDEGSTTDVQIPNWLLPPTQPSAGEHNRGPRRLRDRLMLQALVHGARLYRQLENVPCVTEESLDVEPCDYETVRDLLRSSLIASANEPVDPLAVTMVNRANVYLELKYTPELWQENPSFRLDGDPMARLRGSRTQRELITRREIAELGNVRSQLVRQIVESLKQLPDGQALFQQMGLMRRPPSESAWRIGIAGPASPVVLQTGSATLRRPETPRHDHRQPRIRQRALAVFVARGINRFDIRIPTSSPRGGTNAESVDPRAKRPAGPAGRQLARDGGQTEVQASLRFIGGF